MENFGQAIRNHQLERNRLPSTLEDLTHTGPEQPYPYIDAIPDDPWGNPYHYRLLDAERYELRSNGEDGMPDTDADIVVGSDEE